MLVDHRSRRLDSLRARHLRQRHHRPHPVLRRPLPEREVALDERSLPRAVLQVQVGLLVGGARVDKRPHTPLAARKGGQVSWLSLIHI
eukprot:2535822-Prymnesium_polylepis.1